MFHIDHFVPVKADSSLTTAYDNLLYCCAPCNLAKGSQPLADPSVSLTPETVTVNSDGTIIGKTVESRRTIKKLALDSVDFIEFRRLFIEIATSSKVVLSYPSDLPDLSKKRVPHNSRPEGVKKSAHVLRKAGLLPATY